MNIIKYTEQTKKEIIKQAVDVLSKTGILIYPTETVYGVGVDPTNKEAVNKLLEYKTMRGDKPFSIAVYDKKMAEDYVILNKNANNIYDKLLPGPITVISKSKNKVIKRVESSTDTLGIRIPDFKLIREIIKEFGKPITSTSANSSGQKSPYKISDIGQKQLNMANLIIDYGILPNRPPSTIIDTTLEDINTLRKGSIILENLNKFESNSTEDTKKLCHQIYQEISKYINNYPIIFALQGDLGVGKTFFTQEFCKLINTKEDVKSPTFSICNEYSTKENLNIYHIDTYRLPEENFFDNPIFANISSSNAIFFIEWADKINILLKQILQQGIIINIQFDYSNSIEKRKIKWNIIKKLNT